VGFFERGESSLFEGGLQFGRALIDHDAGHMDTAIADISLTLKVATTICAALNSRRLSRLREM
jgi:hypothetical protein